MENRAKKRVTKFEKNQAFSLAASNKHVYCDKEVTFDTELHVRHGNSLMIRNLKWLVSVENVNETLLGRLIQEALGLEIKEVLKAACDRYGENCNVEDLVPRIPHAGAIRRIISDGIYHPEG